MGNNNFTNNNGEYFTIKVSAPSLTAWDNDDGSYGRWDTVNNFKTYVIAGDNPAFYYIRVGDDEINIDFGPNTPNTKKLAEEITKYVTIKP